MRSSIMQSYTFSTIMVSKKITLLRLFTQATKLRSRMKVEVAIQGSPSLTVMVSVDVEHDKTWT